MSDFWICRSAFYDLFGKEELFLCNEEPSWDEEINAFTNARMIWIPDDAIDFEVLTREKMRVRLKIEKEG